jgi:hypothetical protein
MSGCEITSELTTDSLQLGRAQMMDLALVEAQSFMSAHFPNAN